MNKAKGLLLSATLLWVATCAWSVPFADGAGFGIFTQGATALGQANSVVAHAEGPSALFFNPALINQLPGTQLEAGTTLISPNRQFTEPNGATTTTRDNLFYPSTFYLTHAFNDDFGVGLAVFNPFGLSTDWGGEWTGRYLATKSEIQTYNINPAATYRVLPTVSIAAGLDIILLDATLESKISSTALGIAGPPFDVAQKFTGSGNGVGYNVGFLWDITDKLSLGASYRSDVKINIDGDFSVGISPLMTAGNASITLPQQVFAGISYRISERFGMEVGMRWEDWSSFSRLQINVPGVSTVVYPRDWHDTFAINWGGKYRLSNRYSVSAGYLYGWNPVPDTTFEPAIPDSDTHLFCVGGEAQVNKLKVSLGYGYQLQENRTKTTNRYGPVANGKYDSDLHLLGLSVSWKF
ncbi:MAG: outer membrane protein transport protein [Rectinemataceae bacterium]|nr:outer membrane protein transport protein [Rectinemataceae bacterium]